MGRRICAPGKARHRMTIWPALALLALPAAAHAASLALDPPFTSHAVLQRDRDIAIGGTADAGATVIVTLGSATQSVIASGDGRWRLSFAALKAGGPYVIEVKSGDRDIRLDDVMVGDVWLCSGQSNMEFTLRNVTSATFEVPWSTHPALRLFNTPRQSSTEPQVQFATPTGWQRSAPESAADFSAACYIMGRELQAQQNIPIGLIAASWGGSTIEDWISREALQTLPRYRTELALLDQYRRDPVKTTRDWAKLVQTWLGAKAAPPSNAVWRDVPNTRIWEDWADPALSAFDGVGYYRTQVKLTAAQARQAARIALGSVDDIDLTQVNGKAIGTDQGWNKNRVYQLPAGALKAGVNIIDVTAIDLGGGGGLGGDAPRTLTLADGSILTLSDWTFAKGQPLTETGAPPSVPWIGGSGRTTLYNGMIAPLHDYPVKGFAWYQGEANVNDAKGYAQLMPLLIADWRKRFGAAPFLMVQLANFGPLASAPSDDVWAQLRDVQRRVADADRAVGMASAIDIGQIGDIHPTNKQDVGRRLALAARRIALGETIEDRGPAPVSAARTDGGIVVRFAHGPLKLVGGDTAIGFELCNAAATCRFVSGRLEDDAIHLPADPLAREVRYLWQASPIVNLYNGADLPATGFSMLIP